MKIPVNSAVLYVVDPAALDRLILGPFQGKAACQTIKFGVGVCGTAAATKGTQVVPDVRAYPGQIVCDGDTQSEAVVSIDCAGRIVAVLDIDCLVKDFCDDENERYLELLAQQISTSCAW